MKKIAPSIKFQSCEEKGVYNNSLFESSPIVNFHPYQKKWLADKSLLKVGMVTRQGGKSLMASAEAVDDCILHEIEGKKTRWVILSRGERQAKEAMDEYIKPFIKAFYALYKGILQGEPEFSEKIVEWEGGKYTALEVIFPNGSRITAVPANPDTARGFSANLILDEFAFHENSQKIWAAAFPIVSKGFKLRVISTPNGKENKFYDIITDTSGIWSKHIIDIYEAVKQGLDRDIETLRKGLGDEDAWAQEYEIKFLDGASAWLSYNLITAVEDERAGIPELYKGGACYIGNDIARYSDLWVAVVLEKVGNILWVRETVTLKNKKFEEHDIELDALIAKYGMRRTKMDRTGIGEKPVEDAIRRHGSRVEGVYFTTPNKHIMAIKIKEAFENLEVRIPKCPILRADLHKVKKTISPTGAPRFSSKRDNAGHSDFFWSLCLALVAESEDVGDYEYEPAEKQERKGIY